MKVLLFGGTGFIGRNLTEELRANGYQVYIMVRNLHKATKSIGKKAQLIEWDYNSPIPVNGEIQKVDAIINLAGESIGSRRWTNQVKREILDSRIKTTRAVVTSINTQAIQTKVLINASAVGYYGPRENEEITESANAGDGFLAQVAGKWEDEVNKIQDNLSRIVILRIGVVLGNEGALTKMRAPFKIYMGGPLGSGKQWFPWIHISDLINMTRFIIENEELSGPINAVSPETVRMKEFSKALGEALKRPPWLPVPDIFLKIGLGQMAEMLLYGQKVLPKRILDAGFKFRFPTLASALNDIYKEA